MIKVCPGRGRRGAETFTGTKVHKGEWKWRERLMWQDGGTKDRGTWVADRLVQDASAISGEIVTLL